MHFGGTQVRNNLFVDSTGYMVNIANKTILSGDSICMDYSIYRFREDNFRGINVSAATMDATFPQTEVGPAQFRERTGQERNGKVVVQSRQEMFVNSGSRDFRPKPGSAARGEFRQLYRRSPSSFGVCPSAGMLVKVGGSC